VAPLIAFQLGQKTPQPARKPANAAFFRCVSGQQRKKRSFFSKIADLFCKRALSSPGR
jgi:hypothetical protein